MNNLIKVKDAASGHFCLAKDKKRLNRTI